MYHHSNFATSNAMHEAAHDDSGEVVIVLPQRLTSYVLRLIAGDLRRGARSSAAGMMEEATALAMFLRDSLPENLPDDLRTPVPPLRKQGERAGTTMQAA
jgi:hypothetical protein